LENCSWNRWDKRTWITKIDNEGVAEWSRVFDLELPGWYDPREEHRENLWLSPADELFLGCHYNGQKFLFKLSSEGNLEWNKTLHTYGDDSLFHYHINTGFLIVNNTRLVKLNFNGEIEWITEFLDSEEVESWWGLPHTRLFITEKEEYFIVGRDWQKEYENINGSLYKYRITKINKNGDILWQLEEFGWEKRFYPCSCHYNQFPVYLTPSGLLIITNDLIIINNDGSVNTRSFGSTIVLKTLNYEAEFDNHTYFTIYRISNDKFLKIRGSDVEEWGGYFNATVEISCFSINTNSLWQKNITYSFSQDNVEIPHKCIITTDNDLVMMVKEHNNTNSDHSILFMKITEQGSVPWIYRYTFTSIDPLCVTITKIDSSNLGVPVNSTNWFFPVTVGGMVLIVGITKRRRKR
jgi:hypothetical protein